MNNDCDGVLGATLAVEGTKGYCSLINGPGGCRSRLQNLLREQIHDYTKENPEICSSCFMSRQSRAPCTFLSPDDMIMGSGEKITEGLDSVLNIIRDDVFLIETMGASLQVVERESSVRKCIAPDRVVLSDPDLSSMSFSRGFDDTMVRLLKHTSPSRQPPRTLTVNILGYSVADSSWEEGKKEISSLLDFLGIKVAAFVGCDSKDTLKESGSAAVNILIHPEMSRLTADYYAKELGIPSITPAAGSPIGYPAIRSFLKEIASFFGISADSALDKVTNHEKTLHLRLANCDRVTVALHGYGMTVNGLPSDSIPIIDFFMDLLGLVPQVVTVCKTTDEEDIERLRKHLDSIGCRFALDAPVPSVGLRVFFGDGLTVRYMKEKQPMCAAVGYMMPFLEKQNFISRCIVGFYGCQYLVDMVVNGQDLFFCDQPVGVDFR